MSYAKGCLLLFILLLLIIEFSIPSFSQTKNLPFKCGYGVKDNNELNKYYQTVYSNVEIKKGEYVASVGSSSGYVEVIISLFVDSVNWTLQDIDTVCLNREEVNKVISYYEKIPSKKINSNFEIVIGTETITNLPRKKFDKVILLNVFHEISKRENILVDIKGSLKDKGEIIIMERMATKFGQRHGDCGHLKLMEQDFINEMIGYGFTYLKKVIPNKKTNLTFYTFSTD